MNECRNSENSNNDPSRQLQAYSTLAPPPNIELKLDANEGPLLLNNGSVDSVRCNRYPLKSELESLLAAEFDLGVEQVLVTAGGDEAIDRVCRAYLHSGRNIVFPEPSFEMVRQYALMTGAEIRSVPWLGNEFPTESVLQQIDQDTAVVSLVSPNNPTGQVISLDAVKRIAAAAPQTILLIDQAYAEFEQDDSAGSQSLTQFALENLSNAVVIRTFSKAWGLAGCRVGFATGTRQIIDRLRKYGGPYPVAQQSISQAIQVRRECRAQMQDYVAQVQTERKELVELFSGFGNPVRSSQGNFVYVSLETSPLDCGFVWRALCNKGILVREFLQQNALRVTCPGNATEFTRLQTALETIFKPEAILFDMDGVLADERPSYRAAIELTCRAFGVEIDQQEIEKLKLSGDANNDWEFTFGILKKRDVDCEFGQVKNRFEEIYQGNQSQPGLWELETCLTSKNWLQTIGRKVPLGIVTGRPRLDAERFLKKFDLLDCFQTIVCMEDGPAKPDPTNVQTAMAQLGVKSAWMVGDTPDDIHAANAAGVVSLGIVAPQDDPEFAGQKLKAANAATILKDLNSLEEMLR